MVIGKRCGLTYTILLTIEDAVYRGLTYVIARGVLRPVQGQEAWEYHEPGPHNEPRPLAFSHSDKNIRVAVLQNKVSTNDFFRNTNFLTKKAPKFSPNFLSL